MSPRPRRENPPSGRAADGGAGKSSFVGASTRGEDATSIITLPFSGARALPAPRRASMAALEPKTQKAS